MIFITLNYGCKGEVDNLQPVITPIISTSAEKTPTASVQMSTPSPTFTATPGKPFITNRPPGGVPAAPNSSLIRAEIVAMTQDERGMVLTIDVLSSQSQEGFADFGAAVVGKQIDVLLIENTGIRFSNDQIIMGELVYNGDEKGGVYFLRNISWP